MIILNLFIGVIMNGMQELEKESEKSQLSSTSSADAIGKLDNALVELKRVRELMVHNCSRN
ncbi:hypothetical protein E3A20_20290 [Planctomyces bekefii]|uniref:Uncharacterized protein n=1 Tax=Planctomyces bekefii TaxID=1653850 RepID=A0A5C6M3S0_9PLAN|nr:hypothetical protein E3A20_20290 [Planctomyces bekefii]